MRIGAMTNVLVKGGMKNLDELAEWAAKNGLEDLEVGPTVPLERELYERVLDQVKIRITALTYCRNFLSTDRDEAEHNISELKKRIRFAGALGIEKVVTSTGIDKSVEEGVYDKADAIRKIPLRSLNSFVEVFKPIVELAEKCNVKLAFENCPLMGNIAISPVMWIQIFEKLKSDHIGLAYDPSHLVWQFMDPYMPIREFKDKIIHFHAKDTELDRTLLSRSGFLTDFSWWKYRIAGHGELDWEKLIGELKAIGYNGTISIEHEDPDYEENLLRVQEGIVLAKNYLVPFIKQ